MDHDIQPIAAIQAQGRAAAVAGACPHTANRYLPQTHHWRVWWIGYAAERMERERADTPWLRDEIEQIKETAQ